MVVYRVPVGNDDTVRFGSAAPLIAHIPVRRPSGYLQSSIMAILQIFFARLRALVSKLRVNLTHFLGVFTPNGKYRVRVTPEKQGR